MSLSVRQITGSWRPTAGTGSHEIIALNRPFAARGKLRATFMESTLICKERTNA